MHVHKAVVSPICERTSYMYTNSLGGLQSTPLYKCDTKRLHPHAVTTSCMVTSWLVNNPDTIEGMGHSRHIHDAGDKYSRN